MLDEDPFDLSAFSVPSVCGLPAGNARGGLLQFWHWLLFGVLIHLTMGYCTAIWKWEEERQQVREEAAISSKPASTSCDSSDHREEAIGRTFDQRHLPTWCLSKERDAALCMCACVFCVCVSVCMSYAKWVFREEMTAWKGALPVSGEGRPLLMD